MSGSSRVAYQRVASLETHPRPPEKDAAGPLAGPHILLASGGWAGDEG